MPTSRLEDLPLFDPGNECPKCSYDLITTRYHHDNGDLVCRDHDTFTWGPEAVGQIIGAEHMHRTCDRCSYTWYERPMSEEDAIV